jgi:hypothetical protein
MERHDGDTPLLGFENVPQQTSRWKQVFACKRQATGFGAHDISFIGGLCLMANNICGSAMVQIPGLFQQAGWFLSTLTFIVVAAWTTQSALLLSKTIASMPGNSTFKHRWEFGRVAQTLLPKWAYVVCVFFLVASFISQNISNIIVSSQVMDDTLLTAAKKTCALVIYPSTGGSPFVCVSQDSDDILTDSPFGDGYVVSIGYLIVLAATIPLSYMNLDDNIIVQIGGMGLLTLCVIIWCINFIAIGLNGTLAPVFATAASGGAQSYTGVLPTVLFNFGFVATVPSWLNEKSPATKVTPTLVLAVAIATSLYLMLGFFGAFALNFQSGQDLLSIIADGNIPGMWRVSQICTYIFPIANLMSSIPVFAVIVRYNLVNTGWVPVWAANLISVGSPWLLSLVFYSGNQLNELINWSSALLFVQINLFFPVLLYLRNPLCHNPSPPSVSDYAFAARSAPVQHYPDSASEASCDNKGWDNLLLHAATHGNSGLLASLNAHRASEDEDDVATPVQENIRACPLIFSRWMSDKAAGWMLIGVSVVLAGLAFGLQVYSEVQQDTS